MALIVFSAAAALVMRGKQPTYAAVLDLVKRFDGTLLGHDGFKATRNGASFALRYKSSVAGNHTEITVAIPEGYPLAIFLSRQGPRQAREQELIDVQFADAAFDDRFLVEAAPVAVVRQLLDAEARRFLVKLDDCRIVTRDKALVLTLPVWVSPTDATRAIEGFTSIIVRIRDAFALVSPPLEVVGEPFREMPVARDEARDQAIQRDEVRALYKRHAVGDSQRRIYALLFIVMVIASIGISVSIVLAEH